MDDNNLLEDNNSKNTLKKFLIDKYKMTLLIASVDCASLNGNHYLIDTIIDKMYSTISQRFEKSVVLKIIKVMEQGSIIFLVIDCDIAEVVNKMDNIRKGNLLSSYINIKIISKDNKIVSYKDSLI